MSSEDKNDNEFLISRKGSSISDTTIKTSKSFPISLEKNNYYLKHKIFALNTYNFNTNFVKNKEQLKNNQINNLPSSSTISTISTGLIQQQNIINTQSSNENDAKSDKKIIKLLNNFQYSQLINNLNILFSKIQNLYSQNYSCSNESNLWIENFKYIFNDIIEKNKDNKYIELIKNTLMLMFFSIILIYDINNKNKQRYFIEDIKNILNIHNLMRESIYGNAFNNPNINPEDESQVLMISCKDMNNKLKKILYQYDRLNENKNCNFFPIFKNLKNESFENVYDFYINNVRNPIHDNDNKMENLRNSMNKISIENPYQNQINNSNIPINLYKNNLMNNNNNNHNNNNKNNIRLLSQKKPNIHNNNNIANLNGISAFFDSSNNVFLFRKPFKSSTPNKLRQNEEKIQNIDFKNNITPQRLFSNNYETYNNIPNKTFKTQYSFQEKNYSNLSKSLPFNKKELIDMEKLNTTPKYSNNSFKKIQYNSNYLNTQNSIDTIKNPIINNSKTPMKIRKQSKQKNIGKLNLNILKNQSLTPVKLNFLNNDTLIPFPPSKPYTLVLDLDETLVHVPKGSNSIILRPGLRDFLHSLLPYYELVIFTTGIKEYADQILNFIEIDEKFFSYRLYRQNATIVNDNYYKDLNKLGRDIKKIIIVDDKKVSMELQEENGIIIKPFIFNPDYPNEDYILYDLIRVLIRIAKEKPDDVRISLKNYRLEIYNKISHD